MNKWGIFISIVLTASTAIIASPSGAGASPPPHIGSLDAKGDQNTGNKSTVVATGITPAAGICAVNVAFTGTLITVVRDPSYSNCGNYVTMTVSIRRSASDGARSATTVNFAPQVVIQAWNGFTSFGLVSVTVSAGQSSPHYSGSHLIYPDLKTVASWNGYYGFSYGEIASFSYKTPPKDTSAPVVSSVSVTPDIDRRFKATVTGSDNTWVQYYEWIWNQSSTSLVGTKQTTVTNGWDSTTATILGPPLNYGTSYLHVIAVDASGNRSSPKAVSIRVNMDPYAPKFTSFNLTKLSLRYYSATASATDNVGVIKYRWVWNNSAAATTGIAEDTSKGILPSRKLTPGVWYLHVTAIDSVGNRATRTSTAVVIPEDTAPTIDTLKTSTRFTNSPFQTWTNATVHAQDASGVAKYEWVWNQSATDTTTGVKSITTTSSLSNQHLVSSVADCKKQWITVPMYYLHARAIDKYENASGWIVASQRIERPPCLYGVMSNYSSMGSDGAFLFDGGTHDTRMRVSSQDTGWYSITVGYCYSWAKPSYGKYGCADGRGHFATTPARSGSNSQFMFDWIGYYYRSTSVTLPTNNLYKLWVFVEDKYGRNSGWVLVTSDLVKDWASNNKPE